MNSSQKRRSDEITQDAKRLKLEERDWTSGKIRKINLQNFMCHSNMTLVYHPRVNFLIGANGSGKSALMTALSVALGAKARVTNRCDSLKNLIKTGETAAKIEISIANCGVKGYKTEVYGNEITIIRQITTTSSSYTIKSENGRTVSKKFEELQNILLHHNIQVDNPIFVLNQDASREFLRTMNPSKNYQMFMKATQLDIIYDKIAECAIEHTKYKSRLQSLKTKIAITMKEKLAYEERLQTILSVEDLKKSVEIYKQTLEWIKIKEKEEALVDVKQKIEDIKKVKAELEPMISNKDNMEIKLTQSKRNNDQGLEQDNVNYNNYYKEYTESRKKLGRHREQMIEIESKIKSYKSKIESTNINIAEIDIAICNSEETIANQKQEQNQRKLVALKESLTRSTEQINEEKNKLNLYNQQKIELNEKVQDALKKREDMRRQLNFYDINIANINKKDTLSVYSTVIPNITAIRQKIEALYKEGKFSAQPIGPLGTYIKVPNEKLRDVIESVIGNLLKSFIVNSVEDRELLEEIFKSNCPTANIPIITTKFMTKVYDVTNGCVESPNGTKILMQEIECKHPVVMNCLIDRKQIECILIAENNKAAEILTSQRQNVPQNLVKIIVPAQSTEFYPAPNFRMYSLNIRKAQFIQVDVQDRINQIRNEKISLQENMEKLSMDLNNLRGKQQNLIVHITESRKIVQDGDIAIDEIKENIVELENYEFPTSSNIDQLKNIKDQHGQKLNGYENQLEEQGKKLDVAKRDMSNFEKQLKEQEDLLNKAKKSMEEKTMLKDNLERQFRKINEIYRTSKEKYNENNLEQLKLEKITVKMIEELDNLISLASQNGERIDSDESKADIALKISEISAQIRSRSSITEDPDEIKLKINDLIQELNDNQETYESFKILIQAQWATLSHRKSKNKRLQDSMLLMIKFVFKSVLATRQFSGDFCCDIENRTLDLLVTPPITREIEGAVNSTKSLSGGERSFTTVAFLTALWSCVDHPFIVLDEYDVFTDEVNRAYISRILIQECQKKRRQYTFLTPLDQTLDCENIGKIHRLTAPEKYND